MDDPPTLTPSPAHPSSRVQLTAYRLPCLLEAGLRSVLKPYRDRVEMIDSTRAHTEPRVAVFDPTRTGPSDLRGLPRGCSRIAMSTSTGPHDLDPAAVGADRVISLATPADLLVEIIERAARSTSQRSVAGGRLAAPDLLVGLSQRELEILDEIARGQNNAEIAAALYLSVNTVKTYIRTAYRKIGVTTRTRAVLWAIDHGLG